MLDENHIYGSAEHSSLSRSDWSNVILWNPLNEVCITSKLLMRIVDEE